MPRLLGGGAVMPRLRGGEVGRVMPRLLGGGAVMPRLLMAGLLGLLSAGSAAGGGWRPPGDGGWDWGISNARYCSKNRLQTQGIDKKMNYKRKVSTKK